MESVIFMQIRDVRVAECVSTYSTSPSGRKHPREGILASDVYMFLVIGPLNLINHCIAYASYLLIDHIVILVLFASKLSSGNRSYFTHDAVLHHQ